MGTRLSLPKTGTTCRRILMPRCSRAGFRFRNPPTIREGGEYLARLLALVG